MLRIALHTLGCKLNAAESSAIGRQFAERGHRLVDPGEPADVCVINTCTVTEHADRECRQVIRRALRGTPQPYVIVTGCYAQLAPEEVASITGVDLVLGSKEKFELFRHVEKFVKGDAPHVFVSDVGSSESFGPGSTSSPEDRTRAFLKVQDGCDYSCSFCTIPLARGASRSATVEEVVTEARSLVGRGHREIVLTGVNVGDFGRRSGGRLLELLRVLVTLEGLERLRISSIEPNLLDAALIDFAATNPVVCPHFHIPLQSGSDQVLRLMRRRYTTADYAALVERLAGARPGCGIGVDVIVGFPGESDTLFEETYTFLHGLPVSYLHVFTYSERENTPAAAFDDPVPHSIRRERNTRLRILSEKKRRAFYEARVGSVVSVLTETDFANGMRRGWTPEYVRVGIPDPALPGNCIVPALITGIRDGLCIGNVAGPIA
jgi:threonylcarbamoyladenosine tRNA methylthiotransferase MtaB